MVHNMAPFIRACIESLQWVDSIFIYDDHSTDKSLELALKQSRIPIEYELSNSPDLAFNTSEMNIRNHIIKEAFRKLKVDVLIIADADELFSEELKKVIIENFKDPQVDSLMFSTWHMYDENRYLHFWETKINSKLFVDPHTRVIRNGRRFTPLFGDGSHPIIKATDKTRYLDGFYHFHLKYHKKSGLPNYSLNFLPKHITEKAAAPYIRSLPLELSKNVKHALKLVKWNQLKSYKETPHYDGKRVKLTYPAQALIHPKDYPQISLKRGRDILLFYEKQKWDYVENYSKRSVSGFYAWYTLLVKALKKERYIVHENAYELALANPTYPIGIVGTPQVIPSWNLPNPAILGPSMYDNPQQNPSLMQDKRFKYYILTCDWLKNVFEKVYGKKCILWYAGIPDDEWVDTKEEKKDIDVLIYNKIRWGKDSITALVLDPIREYMEKNGLKYHELKYGTVSHEEYKELLKRSKAMIFLCEHETQGIAYQEAMMSNVPILAWDHGWWTDPVWQAYSEKPIPATSVPVFSKQCGEKFKMISEFPNKFEKFWKKLRRYHPRDYAMKELSMKKSAKVYARYYFKL